MGVYTFIKSSDIVAFFNLYFAVSRQGHISPSSLISLSAVCEKLVEKVIIKVITLKMQYAIINDMII